MLAKKIPKTCPLLTTYGNLYNQVAARTRSIWTCVEERSCWSLTELSCAQCRSVRLLKVRDTKLQNTASTVQFSLTHNSKECVGGLCVLYLSTCGGTRLTSAVKRNMKITSREGPLTGMPIRTPIPTPSASPQRRSQT